MALPAVPPSTLRTYGYSQREHSRRSIVTFHATVALDSDEIQGDVRQKKELEMRVRWEVGR